MKKWKRKVMWILPTSIVLCGLIVFFFFPQYLLKFTYKMYEWKAGVVEKTVTIDNYKITYYESGKGEPLVLIHGFGDSKSSFLQTCKYLSQHYRVILPEVPGFGQSPHDDKRKYSIRNQALFFEAFFQKLELNSFHLGGNSMGGHISAAYTLLYPKKVKSLLLLNAAGVTVTDGLPYELAEKPIRDEEEFEKYVKLVFYEKPFIPSPIKSYFIAQSSRNFDWFNHIRSDIRKGKDCVLNDVVSGIQQKTLVLWGDHDQIVHPNVGELFHKLLPNSQHIVMKNCGHTPQYERPEETSEIISQFLQKK